MQRKINLRYICLIIGQGKTCTQEYSKSMEDCDQLNNSISGLVNAEKPCPKMSKGPSSLWMKNNASYKSNIWTKKAGKGNSIHRQVTLVKYKEW